MLDYDKAVENIIADAEKAAEVIKAADDVLIIAHIDADGITSGAIAVKTCERLGKKHKIVFAKKMDEKTIEMINQAKESVVWIVDLGSGYISHFTRSGIVVTDHHQPDSAKPTGQITFDSFSNVWHVNPHIWGIDGTTDASGSTMTYLVAKAVDPKNKDLAFLSIVGSSGDLQDSANKRLVGLNRRIIKDAEEAGDLCKKEDLKFFGKESRALLQFFQYSNEPKIEGLSDDRNACLRFLEGTGVPLKGNGGFRPWSNLNDTEKGVILQSLKRYVDLDTVTGECYYFPKFKDIKGLGEAKEFATVLNSCGRYDDCETGLLMCFGDENAMKKANEKREDHRKNISRSITYVRENCEIVEKDYIQYYSTGTEIPETLVGIVTGMVLKDHSKLPLFAFAETEDGVKVSARADSSFAEKGLNLSKVMETAAALCGGFGGGHTVAAGATIPKGKEKEFLEIAEDIVSSQVR